MSKKSTSWIGIAPPESSMDQSILENNPTSVQFLTRKKVAEYISEKMGIPIGLSSLEKLWAKNEGPPVARYYGKTPLYLYTDVAKWAMARTTRPATFGNPFLPGALEQALTTSIKGRRVDEKTWSRFKDEDGTSGGGGASE